MAAIGLVCDSCAAPARVRILDGYRDGAPQIRTLCLRCAEGDAPPVLDAAGVKERLPVSTLLAVVGISLAFVGLFGDTLTFTVAAGFGWYQKIGAAVAVVLILLGALLKTDLIVLSGGFLFLLACGADWLGGARTPGFGWKQELAVLLAVMFVAAAMLGRTRVRAGSASLNGKPA
jgi:hypothetical protein